MAATVSELLDRAADLLERDGWCQGTYYDTETGRCLVGALHGASADLALEKRASGETATALMRRAEHAIHDAVGMDIEDWNDDEATTFADVLDLLRTLAAERRWDEPKPQPKAVPIEMDERQASGLLGWWQAVVGQ